MSTLREAAQQALEALQEYQSNGAPFLACDEAVAALRAALAQQDESEMYAAAYSSACGELRKVEAQCDALLELVVEMDQHEGAEGWSEDLRIKINSALMQALEALAWKAGSEPALYGAQTLQAITALSTAVAQQAEPVQEPVAWLQPKTVDGYSRPDLGYETCSRDDYGAFPVHTSPPQRKPLTEEEIDACFHAARNAKLGASQDNSRHRLSVVEIARAVERAHGIKE